MKQATQEQEVGTSVYGLAVYLNANPRVDDIPSWSEQDLLVMIVEEAGDSNIVDIRVDQPRLVDAARELSQRVVCIVDERNHHHTGHLISVAESFSLDRDHNFDTPTEVTLTIVMTPAFRPYLETYVARFAALRDEEEQAIAKCRRWATENLKPATAVSKKLTKGSAA